jgi:hypothetical protein
MKEQLVNNIPLKCTGGNGTIAPFFLTPSLDGEFRAYASLPPRKDPSINIIEQAYWITKPLGTVEKGKVS